MTDQVLHESAKLTISAYTLEVAMREYLNNHLPGVLMGNKIEKIEQASGAGYGSTKQEYVITIAPEGK
jgi:hypothetical protein